MTPPVKLAAISIRLCTTSSTSSSGTTSHATFKYTEFDDAETAATELAQLTGQDKSDIRLYEDESCLTRVSFTAFIRSCAAALNDSDISRLTVPCGDDGSVTLYCALSGKRKRAAGVESMGHGSASDSGSDQSSDEGQPARRGSKAAKRGKGRGSRQKAPYADTINELLASNRFIPRTATGDFYVATATDLAPQQKSMLASAYATLQHEVLAQYDAEPSAVRSQIKKRTSTLNSNVAHNRDVCEQEREARAAWRNKGAKVPLRSAWRTGKAPAEWSALVQQPTKADLKHTALRALHDKVHGGPSKTTSRAITTSASGVDGDEQNSPIGRTPSAGLELLRRINRTKQGATAREDTAEADEDSALCLDGDAGNAEEGDREEQTAAALEGTGKRKRAGAAAEQQGAASKPAASKPTASKPAAGKGAAAKPAAGKGAAAKPAAGKPAAGKGAAAKGAAAKPAAAKGAAAKPAAATAKPAAAKRARQANTTD